MAEIVKGKVHADFEDSKEDDFLDLRQDLQNFVAEKHETSSKELKEELEDMKTMLKSILDHQNTIKETGIIK